MTTETNPPQTEEITRAIAEALAVNEPAPDAWWQAGIDDDLESFDVCRGLYGRAAPAEQARRGARVVEP